MSAVRRLQTFPGFKSIVSHEDARHILQRMSALEASSPTFQQHSYALTPRERLTIGMWMCNTHSRENNLISITTL
jgi:hypothetical protein